MSCASTLYPGLTASVYWAMTASSSITWSSNRRISSFWRRWLLWSPAEPEGSHTHHYDKVSLFRS